MPVTRLLVTGCWLLAVLAPSPRLRECGPGPEPARNQQPATSEHIARAVAGYWLLVACGFSPRAPGFASAVQDLNPQETSNQEPVNTSLRDVIQLADARGC